MQAISVTIACTFFHDYMPNKSSVLNDISRLAPKLLSNDDWLPVLLETDRAALAGTLMRRMRYLPEFAIQAIQENQQQEAENWLALALHCDPRAARDAIGTSGVLRSSKYKFKVACLEQVVATLRNQAQVLSLPEDVSQYLDSVAILARAALPVRHMDNSVREFLNRHQDSALKSIIALTDSLFMLGHEGDFATDTNDIRFYSKEDLAEGASYLIHCFDEDIGISDSQFNSLAEKSLIRGLVSKVVVKACKIRHFCEAEILVDAFDYRCTLRQRVVSVAPPFSELEKSIRLGYVLNEQASLRSKIDRIAAIRDGQQSLLDAADLFYDRFHDRIVTIFEQPVRRYVFQFPDVPQFRAIFSQDGLMVEESIYLKEILSSELITWDEIKRFEVQPGVSVFDLLKAYRLFMFFARVATKHLTTVLSEDPGLAYRSLVAVFKISQLEALLGWCLPKAAIDAIIGMLSWKTGAAGMVDIQYKPILNGGEYYLVPLNITGMTNWYRNLAYTQKRRAILSADEEASSRALAAALDDASDMVRKGYETVLDGERIEIDVACRFGDYLFLFECKHALLPCNIHELRTSYDHIKTGSRQLDRISRLLSRKDLEEEFYRRLKWQTRPAKELVTCIVSCNGMFPGLSVSGHPVRRWSELRNMIGSGVVRVGVVSGEQDERGPNVRTDGLIERNLWGGDKLTPAFLREYIKGNRIRDTFFDAMIPWQRSYRMENWEIVFPTFVLDGTAVEKTIRGLA